MQNDVDSSRDPPSLRQYFKLKYLEVPVETFVQYLHNFLRSPEIFYLHARIGRTGDSLDSG